MIDIDKITEGFIHTSPLEWIAFLLSLLYVIFAALKNNICWIFAGIASVIYTYLCFSVALYLESVLQAFYIVMALVGWMHWNSTKELRLDIKMWSITQHLLNVVISGALALVLGYLFDNYTTQANPYADSFTTIFSLTATFMVTKKVLENWVYWVVIDIVSIYLYHQRGLELTALLFVVFTIIAIIGFFAWRKMYSKQRA